MDDLTYQVLCFLEAGNSVFRPRETSPHTDENFRDLVTLLDRLKAQQFVTYLSTHISQTKSGIYLMAGPVYLTPAGGTALERDRSLGARPPWTGSLPWRS